MHDVKARCEFADALILDRREIHRHRILRLRVANSTIDAIPQVARLAFDEKLGGPFVMAFHLDLEVDVRRLPAWIAYRLECAEVILAGGTGQKSPEALEVRIVARFIPALRQIDPVLVRAPNFDVGVSDRI